MVVAKKISEDKIYEKQITLLLKELDISYKHLENYKLAFVHRSLVNERPDFTPVHNERLEFLGDAVLELAITDNLYKEFSEKPEGELTDIRSALVRGRNLALVARKLGFAKYLLLGKGEEKSGGRDNDYILANTFESFLGAVYLDSGSELAFDFATKHVYSTLRTIHDGENTFKDFKTIVQELIQAQYDLTPNYEVLSEDGPDHDKSFEVGIYMKDELIGKGIGTSKKKAQEDSAKNAYNKLKDKLGL